jgi:hypothetical protein
MLFPGSACDVWPRELPPGWELEWVDDEERLHHGQASHDVIVPFSYLPLFAINSELFLSCQRTIFVIMDPWEFDVNL